MHTWQNTQTEGWVRIALDECGIPYDYISVHAVRDNPEAARQIRRHPLRPVVSADAFSIVNGVTGDKPMPWKKTDLTPNLGTEDSTDDMRGGIELDGVLHLRDFVKDGGVFITLSNSSALPIQFGLAQGLSIRDTQNLWARGGVYKADIGDRTSPLVYGYDDTLGIYFSQSPVFAMGGMSGRGMVQMTGMGAPSGRVSGRGTANDPDIPQGRARDIGQQDRSKNSARPRKTCRSSRPRKARARRRRRPSGPGSC